MEEDGRRARRGGHSLRDEDIELIAWESIMGENERVVYEERTPWPRWATFLLWVVMLGSVAPFVLDRNGFDFSDPRRTGVVVGMAGLAWAVHVLLGGLTVRVTRTGLRIGLGNAALLRTWIAFRQLHALESVTYRPIREFGGWGLRGRRAKRAWTARGNRAVILHLSDGRDVYVGSDNPRRLEERIRTYWERSSEDR